MKNKNLNIKLVAFLIVVVLLFGAVFFIRNRQNSITSSRLQITTSFYPLYYFASAIGGDKVNVINITPAGAEPHDYEPSTKDIINIQNSSLLVINGANLENWAGKIKDIVKGNKPQIVEASQGLAHINSFEDNSGVPDPHVWLDPVLAQRESEKIYDALLKVDPENKDYYQTNFSDLVKSLKDLDQEYKLGLKSCNQNIIVTSHSAFSYLADRYGLVQLSIAGLSPDIEPSPKQIAEISNLVKEKGIKYIFFEELTSPRISETLANETGAKTLLFDPLEGLTPQNQKKGENYLTIQRNNLQNLRIALECK